MGPSKPSNFIAVVMGWVAYAGAAMALSHLASAEVARVVAWPADAVEAVRAVTARSVVAGWLLAQAPRFVSGVLAGAVTSLLAPVRAGYALAFLFAGLLGMAGISLLISSLTSWPEIVGNLCAPVGGLTGFALHRMRTCPRRHGSVWTKREPRL